MYSFNFSSKDLETDLGLEVDNIINKHCEELDEIVERECVCCEEEVEFVINHDDEDYDIRGYCGGLECGSCIDYFLCGKCIKEYEKDNINDNKELHESFDYEIDYNLRCLNRNEICLECKEKRDNSDRGYYTNQRRISYMEEVKKINVEDMCEDCGSDWDSQDSFYEWDNGWDSDMEVWDSDN